MRMLGQVFWAEIRRERHRLRTYSVEFAAAQALLILGFVFLSGLFTLVASGQYSSEARLLSLIGYFTWLVADGSFMRIVQSYAEEASWGTLEQAWLCPLSPGALLFVRSLVALLSSALRGLVTGGVIMLLFGQSIGLPLSSILIFTVTQLGVIGLAFSVVGLQYVNKSVQSATTVVSFLLLFVTGAISPLPQNTVVYHLGQFLPLGLGVSLLREVTADPIHSYALLFIPQFWALIGQSTLYVLLGWVVLRWGQRTAQVQGSLGHY